MNGTIPLILKLTCRLGFKKKKKGKTQLYAITREIDLKESPQRETDSTVNVASESQNAQWTGTSKCVMLCKDNLPHIV